MRNVMNGAVSGVMTQDAVTRTFQRNGNDEKVVTLDLQVGKGFVHASVFGRAADHAEKLTKGQALLVKGDLSLNQYEDKNKNKASSIEVRVDPYYGIQYVGTKDDPKALDLNEFQIGGRLTGDPEEMKTGVRGSIAVDTARTDAEGNPVTVFFPYMAFDDAAVKALKALKKGSEVVLTVAVSNGTYTNKNDQKVAQGRLIVTGVHGYAEADVASAPAEKREPKAKAEPKEEKPEVKADVVTDVPDQGVDSLGLDFDDLEL